MWTNGKADFPNNFRQWTPTDNPIRRKNEKHGRRFNEKIKERLEEYRGLMEEPFG